jgi:hypothetical protein
MIPFDQKFLVPIDDSFDSLGVVKIQKSVKISAILRILFFYFKHVDSKN